MKDAYYFSHDSNAKDDPKCMLLIETLQLEGYGIFWMLVETLRDQPSYKYPIALIPALARRYNTTSDKLRTVIYNFGLFEIENDEFFYSHSLNRRMEKWDERREQRRLAGIASGKSRKQKALIERPFNGCSTNVELRKEKKREEKKGEEIKIDYTITDSIIDYFNEKTGKNLRHKDVSRKPIKARLNENFTFEECKQVIDIKYDEWIDDENMAKFIRISTFFGNKFEIYLNQQVEEKLSASAREMMKRAFSGARL